MCNACSQTTAADTFHCCVLIVSDTAHADSSTDKSGALLSSILNEHGAFSVIETAIVPDEISKIQAKTLEWSANKVNLVITSGGTGFSPRDVTPEAVKPLIVKDAPGLVHLMMAASLKITPMAAMSRPVCGSTSTGSIIVTIPGSPKGAKENLEAILPVLTHALRLASGESSRTMHASGSAPNQDGTLPQTHSNQHSHSHLHQTPTPHTHKSSDPAQGATRRHRTSPYPIIPLEEAISMILNQTPVLEVIEVAVKPETITGHILAEDIVSDCSIPVTQTTNVDGYAVLVENGPGQYPVQTGKSHPLPHSLNSGTIYRVNTGSPIPEGADAVIMVEDTQLVETLQVGQVQEEKVVEILAQVKIGENIRQPGSDVKKGDLILAKGTAVSASGGEIASLCFVGSSKAKVVRKPVVAVLSTGNEIIDVGGDAAACHSMYDTNRPALLTALRSAGYSTTDLGICGDTVDATLAALKKGAEVSDVILATGGTSMGEADLLKPVIERHLDGNIVFGRVAMKPGLPTTFATFQYKGKQKIIFSLPGNPASALVTYNIFVLPCLRKLTGYSIDRCQLPRLKAQLTTPLALDHGRPEFHRVHVKPTQTAPYLSAASTGQQRSSKASSMAAANGYACLPAGKDGGRAPQKGDLVDVVLISGL